MKFECSECRNKFSRPKILYLLFGKCPRCHSRRCYPDIDVGLYILQCPACKESEIVHFPKLPKDSINWFCKTCGAEYSQYEEISISRYDGSKTVRSLLVVFLDSLLSLLEAARASNSDTAMDQPDNSLHFILMGFFDKGITRITWQSSRELLS